MKLNPQEKAMLDGKEGPATQKAMQILTTLGKIYGAEKLIPAKSVQIAGVSYDNLGEAGLSFLEEMATGGGKTRTITTLNPAGMDIENWEKLGISPEFARNQNRVLEAFSSMGVNTTCSCTPYLVGNNPNYGDNIAWSESSAVCYANSVIGARTNREGGPSALAAALTGKTPAYGYHIEENRKPTVSIKVNSSLEGTYHFGALGLAISKKLDQHTKKIPFITGISSANLEELKSFCASIATYAGAAIFHMQGITPEAYLYDQPSQSLEINERDIDQAKLIISSKIEDEEIDFVSLGCPHLAINEIARIAEILKGKEVKKEFWITTGRPTKKTADSLGYSKIIEASGAKFATDTCCVVAPIKGRFKTLVTDSAKACYYGASKNNFKTLLLPFDDVVEAALK
ncbi:MAG: DUF521 domain-containing protein [Chloroflexi bacterium]|jgi:predicted aconitase|nr:DUF521 domain-containing protein [Chloroflexota bacterium]MBT4002558.1 DUF521 domain-containing protein [Chloroflexota bacterium]MBT4305824.1 DUF521 domain-containing protein [Chloroflexota bacterium]MBT4533648.1 DUF521 domain-containing protein [Chloroflexota bacterium]MBT4681709.1 DUF521 domain-containing protein [Chloroflexota bacterium]